jgi:hypothetical protein
LALTNSEQVPENDAPTSPIASLWKVRVESARILGSYAPKICDVAEILIDAALQILLASAMKSHFA